MPTYKYECSDCGYVFDQMQSMSDAKLKTCPICKKDTLNRLIGTGSGIIFKGTGFYETDYKNKSACPMNNAGSEGSGCSNCPSKKGSE